MNEWMNEIYFCVKKHGIHKVQNKEISYHIKLTVHYIFPKILHKKRLPTPPRQKAAVGYTKYLKKVSKKKFFFELHKILKER